MTPYWVRFKSTGSFCIEASSEADAIAIGTGLGKGEVIGISCLPYPAAPRLGVQSDCPSFCYTPSQCAGQSCCRKNPCCVD